MHVLLQQITHFSDIDECIDSSDNNCSSNANCTDTIGSYDCTCVIGYTGDGFRCEGMIIMSSRKSHLLGVYLSSFVFVDKLLEFSGTVKLSSHTKYLWYY